MRYLFTSVRLKTWKSEFSSMKMTTSRNTASHIHCKNGQKQLKDTAQRWHDIMKSRQMYDTEIRNKTIIKVMISDKSLIRQLNKKHSLIKLKKGELNTKAELKSECFILFSLFVHNKVLQILQINGKTID